MKKINGKWIHDGKEYEVVDGACSDCPFKPGKEGCSLEQSCPIGMKEIFKLKEPKMKKEELTFKVLTPTVERAEKLKVAMEKAGIEFPGGSIHEVKAVKIIEGRATFWSDPFVNHANFDSYIRPEVTFAEALELLKRVEPAAPEFDIKLRDEVLCRDSKENTWEIRQFARVKTPDGFQTFGSHFYHMVKYTGNEHLHGTTNTPSGWWQCVDGKPVWRSK